MISPKAGSSGETNRGGFAADTQTKPQAEFGFPVIMRPAFHAKERKPSGGVRVSRYHEASLSRRGEEAAGGVRVSRHEKQIFIPIKSNFGAIPVLKAF